MRLFAVGAVLLLPSLAFATPRTLSELASTILTILAQGTLVLMILAVAIYFWSIAYNMLKISKGEAAEWKSHFFWGIIAIFVMVSLWGIVQILQNTIFNPGSAGAAGGGEPCARFGDPGCGG